MLAKFILTDKEKYDDDKQGLKDVFNYHLSIGESQVFDKDEAFRKLYNLSYGIINNEDYIDDVRPLEERIGIGKSEIQPNLKFFPIIPNLVQGILNENDKKYGEYKVFAANPEATNEIIEKLNEDLRNNLVQSVTNLFLSENEGEEPAVMEEKMKMLMGSEKIQRFYQAEYRNEFEKWCNYMMGLEDNMFSIKTLERKVLEQIIVTENPVVHVEYLDGKYYPEVLSEKDCFYLKSPKCDDLSDSMMFGWFTYENLSTILNKYAGLMSEEDVEKVEQYTSKFYGNGFVINNEKQYLGDSISRGYDESTQNFLNFRAIERGASMRDFKDRGATDSDLCKVTTIYFMLPRKKGYLTYKSNGKVIYKDIVDEYFEPTIKPIYKSKKKDSDSLISGEHVEWFYTNELYRGRRLDYSISNNQGQVKNNDHVWLELDRYDVALTDPNYRYGVKMPIHGGSITNQFNESVSMVQKMAPYQIMYNWLWNRNEQLLATEIGKFFAMPDGMIPNESIGESWNENDLSKFALLARDTGIAPLANPLNSGANPNLGFSGIGQMIDLTKTQEVMEKAQLARMIKEEAYLIAGLSPQYLFGDNSPNQSARSVAMGNQRSSTQIQHLFTRLSDIMVKVRTTMLEVAKHIAINNPTSEISYMTPDGLRSIFRTSTKTFPLYSVGIFAKSNVSDLDVIESIKSYVISNNTLGIDSVEMATLFTFKSIPELFDRLKALKEEKMSEQQKQFEQQQQMQQQQIEAQQQQQQIEIAAREREAAIKHEREMELRQVTALGYANSTAEEIRKEIELLMRSQKDETATTEAVNFKKLQEEIKDRQHQDKMEMQRNKVFSDRDIKLKELELRQKELEAQNRRTEALKIDKK